MHVFAFSSNLANNCFHLYFASCGVEYSLEYVLNARGGGGLKSISLKGVEEVDECGRQLCL